MLARLKVLWSNLVFWVKSHAGFRQLGPTEVTGRVLSVETSSDDGDVSFDLDVESTSVFALVYTTKGADGTTRVAHTCTRLHCEVRPAEHARLANAIARLAPGVRVRVGGWGAWDGCHHGKGLAFDVFMALVGAAPVVDGWVEIHPVTALEILS